MNDEGYTLARKQWDSEFFGREIHSLSISSEVSEKALEEALSSLDNDNVWGIECPLSADLFTRAPLLEELGFRLIDSRMVFISQMTREEIPELQLPRGTLRQVSSADLPEIEELTVRCLVDNPLFKSLYKDRRLFSREESIRYYSAWNLLAFNQDPDLFVVWVERGRVVGFFNYLRRGTEGGQPLFKGGLTAVADSHRGHGAHNAMQAFLFPRFGVPTWTLDNTTQVTNLPVIRNHIRAGRTFKESVLIFYRVNSGSNTWKNS